MAVTAKFQADFTDFLEQSKKAVGELAHVEKAADSTAESINNLTGRTPIENFARMNAKMEELAHTADEKWAKSLFNVGAATEQTSQKLSALGHEAPQDMKKLVEVTNEVEKSTKGVASAADQASKSTGAFSVTIGKLTAALSISNLIDRGISTLASWTSEVVTSAGALVDMSSKTGISIEQLQRFGAAGSQAGVSVESFSNAAFKLGVTLDSGDKRIRKTIEGMDGLGVSFDQLRALSPDQQFNKIIASLEAMEDPQERNRVGVELFGKSFASIAPAIAAGYSEMAAAAQVSSDEQVKAVDAAADAWDDFVSRQKKTLLSSLGNVLLLHNAVAQLKADAEKGFRPEGFANFLTDTDKSIKSIEDLDAALIRAAGAHDIVLKKQKEQASVSESYAEELRKAQAELAGLNKSDLEAIAIGKQLGKTTDELSIRFGISEAALRLLNEQTREHEAANKKAQAADKKLADELSKGTQAFIDGEAARKRFDANLANVASNTDRLGDHLKGLSVSLDAGTGGWINNQRALDAWWLAAAKGADSGTELLKNLRGLGVELPKLADHSKEVHRLAEEFVALAQIGGDSFNGLARGIGTFVVQLDKMHDSTSEGGMLGDLKALKTEWDELSKSQKGSLAIMGALQVASAVTTGKAQQVLSAASKGAQIGSIAGIWGTAIGAGVGALVGAFQSLEKQINPVRQAFVDAAGGLDALNKRAHDAGTTLDQLLNAKNPEQYKAAIDALNKSFAAFDQHVKDVGAGLKQAASGANALAGSLLGPLNDLQKQLDDATNAAGKSSVSLAKLLIKKPGKNDADAAKYGLDLASSIFEGFKDALGDEALAASLSKELQAAVAEAQPVFEHLGQYVAATFAAQIHEGASAFEAFQNLAPSFQALQDGISKFGLESSDTIDSLLKIQGVVGANKDVADSIQALSDIYDGLTQAGYLTKDLFESFAEDISHQFDLLVSRGADGTTALQLMQPELQKLWEGQQKFGDITDESTKKLLDQAEQQGLVGEDMKNVNDKILDVLLSIADVFGAKLPKSLQAMVDATKKAQSDAQKALDGIHAPDLTIGVHFNVDNLNLPDGQQPIAMARGGSGIVTRPTLFVAGEAGAEPFAFGDAAVGGDTSGLAGELRALRDEFRAFPRAIVSAFMLHV